MLWEMILCWTLKSTEHSKSFLHGCSNSSGGEGHLNLETSSNAPKKSPHGSSQKLAGPCSSPESAEFVLASAGSPRIS